MGKWAGEVEEQDLGRHLPNDHPEDGDAGGDADGDAPVDAGGGGGGGVELHESQPEQSQPRLSSSVHV